MYSHLEIYRKIAPFVLRRRDVLFWKVLIV